MSLDDETEPIALLRRETERARGYADFFAWTQDRDLEEWGVVTSLAESMQLEGAPLFHHIKSRGRPNDPPDCEAVNSQGDRVAIEVTELVDGEAIKRFKAAQRTQQPPSFAAWEQTQFLSRLTAALLAKDNRFPSLRDPPYPGGYVVVVHTDEPLLDRKTVAAYLREPALPQCQHITRGFLLLSYDPSIGRCPYFEVIGTTINQSID